MNVAGDTYLYGAGGHAKVILEILEASGVAIGGLFADVATVADIWGYEVGAFPGKFDAAVDALIVAIGDNGNRRRKVESLQVTYGLAVDPSAVVSPRAKLGEGTVVMAGTTINSEAVIGDHCIVNTSASIDHECVIEDYAHISPNTTLCGNVAVGEGTHIGAGAVVIPGIRIGRWAVVGAGAVVIRDVPDGAVVVGSPAKPLGTQPKP